MTVLWLVGEPGIGKTTLARELLGLYGPYRVLDEPKQKWTITSDQNTEKRIAAAGHYTGDTFDGADTVGYSGAEAHLKFWYTFLAPSFGVTLFDGDRFSHAGAVNFFIKNEPTQKLVCVRLIDDTVVDDLAKKRRAARGSNQNATWLKGRATKARNFYDAFPGRKSTLDASFTPLELAVSLKHRLEHST